MSDEVVRALVSRFGDSLRDVGSANGRVTFTADRQVSHETLAALQSMEFDHLSDVTGVDYPADGEFEVVYHLWSHTRKVRLIQKVRIPRDSPLLQSATDLWPGAQIHEREIHELFGIGFEGNPNLSPLFLENWTEIPPFRKDFDTREYVRRRDHVE